VKFRCGSCFFNIRNNFINSYAIRGVSYDWGVKRPETKSPPAARHRKIIFVAVLAIVFVWTALPARPYRPLEPIPAGIGAGGPVCSCLPECGSAAQTAFNQASVRRKEILWK